MGLEKDINQKRFRNEWQKAMINLTYTHNWMTERFKSILDRFDLTAQQFNILRILRGAGEPLSTLQIRERMLDKMSDTSRIVDRLILKKMVRKSTCAHDKRLVDVVITDAGKLVLEKIDQLNNEMDSIISGLSTEEAAELNRLLDKMREPGLN
ncbi:MAG: MarR family transcriptional regulator [Chitinophagaceae bacterium]|nr:MarR family transcriptional regulator [Chitinophagaceae bacterium]MCU0403514.1 MarR family transcriptional regulator [Chitinophagaceae bacterium]